MSKGRSGRTSAPWPKDMAVRSAHRGAHRRLHYIKSLCCPVIGRGGLYGLLITRSAIERGEGVLGVAEWAMQANHAETRNILGDPRATPRAKIKC